MAATRQADTLPVTTVRRGDVTVTVTARGELQGGNIEMLTAPMTGGNDMAITFLRTPGELVQAGDVVVQVRHHRAGVPAARGRSRPGRSRAAGASRPQAESQAQEEETRYRCCRPQPR